MRKIKYTLSLSQMALYQSLNLELKINTVNISTTVEVH